jgi:uncharacterized membrane protein YqaE (UPF0057 family)
MYLLAFIFPPLAVEMHGKQFQAFQNLFLTLFFWFPGVIHALLVVSAYKADLAFGVTMWRSVSDHFSAKSELL